MLSRQMTLECPANCGATFSGSPQAVTQAVEDHMAEAHKDVASEFQKQIASANDQIALLTRENASLKAEVAALKATK